MVEPRHRERGSGQIVVTAGRRRPAIIEVPPQGSVAASLSWVAGQREAVIAALAQHGALIVRGLSLREPAEVGLACRRLHLDLMAEREGFAERDSLPGGLYSSLHWPAADPICMHHELSYRCEVPGLLVLACLREPATGGVTGVADAEAVLADLPAELVARFERLGWLLTRHYQPAVGVAWQTAFGTTEPGRVTEYCRRHRIAWRWTSAGGLVTQQRRRAVIRDPATGHRRWFNQIAFLNEWTMEPVVRDFLRAEFGPDTLPFNTAYGDGTPINADVVRTINAVYDAHTRREPWRAGDVLLVDNLRMAHSREPYTGGRRVVVAMTQPMRVDNAWPTQPKEALA